MMENSDSFGHFPPNLTWDFLSNESDLHSEIGMWLPCHFQFHLMLSPKTLSNPSLKSFSAVKALAL